MSWDQGIQTREDLPEAFIRIMEALFERKFNKPGYLQYITWFGVHPEVLYVDFGTNESLELNWPEIERILKIAVSK
jgi:hypothetical protein